MKETELAQHFINYFKGFDIYKEVQCGGIIDIVVLNGNITTAVEVKCSLNFDVIEQAQRNTHCANYSYVAVPYPKSKTFAYQICKQFGIGVLCLTVNGSSLRVIEVVKPKLNRNIRKMKLEQWQKESVAGSQNDRMTAFKNTSRTVVEHVRRNGSVHIKELLKSVPTHYGSISSANACIVKMINSGVIKELEVERGIISLKKADV